MNSGLILNLLGSGAIVTIILAAIKFFENRSSLKAGKGRTSAETESVNLANQAKVIETLQGENARLTERLAAAEKRADAAASRADDIDKKFDLLSEQFYKLQREQARFRDRVEDLLTDNGLEVPAWWHPPATSPGSAS